MICPKCAKNVPQESIYCMWCGKKIAIKAAPKKRGNGQGSVYKKGNKYLAVKTVYEEDKTGSIVRRTVQKSFDKKKDAVNALPLLTVSINDKKAKRTTTLQQLYDTWLPTHTAGKSTMEGYSAAFKHLSSLHDMYVHLIEIEDIEECFAQEKLGKRTKQNMKTLLGLLYKYGIPRGYFTSNLNLSNYIVVRGEDGDGGVGLPLDYLEVIRKNMDIVSEADIVYAHCYLGFRPAELLALTHESYDPEHKLFIGGAKTEAGKDRIVTISPKIQPIIDKYAAMNSDPKAQFFRRSDGTSMSTIVYRDRFYAVLEELGLDNPKKKQNEIERHTYTPHSCRHTFATLMKKVAGSGKDKMSLIGHSSEEMLRYYQDVPVDDLREITDKL